jgi:hypothetical protein
MREFAEKSSEFMETGGDSPIPATAMCNISAPGPGPKSRCNPGRTRPGRLARAPKAPMSIAAEQRGFYMRNAALILGIIGGIIGMIVGFFSFGYVEFVNWFGEIEDLAEQVDNAALIQGVSLLSPLLAIAGGAMARSQAMIGGVLMLVSAAGMYWAFGFGAFTMFPIAMCGLGGVLALAARQPDAA